MFAGRDQPPLRKSSTLHTVPCLRSVLAPPMLPAKRLLLIPLFPSARSVYLYHCLCDSDSLPLQGSIPDMTADSESYIRLQQVYRDKATEHVHEIHSIANSIKESIEGVSCSTWSLHAYL